MKYIEGKIFTESGFKKGYLSVSESKILEISFGNCSKRTYLKGLIIPSLINMHTHLGDAFISKKDIALPHDIMSLVAPPDGLKYKLLENSSDKEIIQGMKDAIQTMMVNGIICFFDFRENGIQGIDLLKNALKQFLIHSHILSRPKDLIYDEKEMRLLLERSDGIGLSSITDWKYDDVIAIAEHTRKRKKYFSLHASERIRENIKKIIDLHPDFIIHMTKASKTDLEAVKNENIPIVICPQSNTFFNLKPPLKLMKEVGNTIFIGSDNAMLHPPNLLDEINHIKNIEPGLFSFETLLDMVTYGPRKALNLSIDMHDEMFPVSSYTILDEQTLQPLINTMLMREMI